MITLQFIRDSYPQLVVYHDMLMIQKMKRYEDVILYFYIGNKYYLIHFQMITVLIVSLNNYIENQNQNQCNFDKVINFIHPREKNILKKILNVLDTEPINFPICFSYIFDSKKDEIYDINSNSYVIVENKKKITVQVYLPQYKIFYIKCSFETLKVFKHQNKNKELFLNDKYLKKSKKLKHIDTIIENVNQNSFFFIRF